MDKNINLNQPHYSIKQRMTALLTLLFFLFQTTGAAIAATVSALDIQENLNSTLEFERASGGGSYQYVATSDLLEQSALGVYTIEDFVNRLRNEYVVSLGAPVYVPIAVGDITTIIPTYPQPKAVGSPFVQSRYLRNQIHQILGRHLIDSLDHSTERGQLSYLYNNAVTYAKDAQALYGQPLGLDQEAGPMDMVWPERHVINGKAVMVPVVYLTAQTVSDRKVTEPTREFNGQVQFGNIVAKNATIKLARENFLKVSNNLSLVESSIVTDDERKALTLVAGGTLSLLSSNISSAGDLVIGAHNVQSQTLVYRYDLGYEHGTRFGEISQFNAAGDVAIRSYSDIVLQGTDVTANNITMAADGSIYIGAIANTYGEDLSGRWRGEWSAVDYLQSHLTAEESITLMAGGQIVIDAAELIANTGHIELLAQLGITVQDELGQYQRQGSAKFGKKKVTESVYQTVAIRSVLDAGRGVKLHTDFGDITLKAVDIRSTEGTQVKAANGAVNLLLTKETDHYAYSSVKKGMFTTSTVNRGYTNETPVYNTIVGGFSVEALKGVNVEYEGLKDLECQAYLGEIGVTPPSNEDPCLRANVLKISSMPGMEWMGQVLALADADPEAFNWDEIAFEHKAWNERHRSLSPAFAAVVAIALAVAMGPAGLNIGAMVVSGTGAVAAGLSAGAVALAAQASMAVINGVVDYGRIGQAMEDFASDETLKSLATTMITAGAIEALDAAFFDADRLAVNSLLEAGPATPDMIQEAMEGATQSLKMQVGQALTNASVTAGVDFIVQGGNFEDLGDQFVVSLGQNAINLLGRTLTEKIGDASRLPGDEALSTAARYIAHAGLGCVSAAATNDLNDSDTSGELSCLSGSFGATVGEFIATQEMQDFEEDLTAWARGAFENGGFTESEFYAQGYYFAARNVDFAKLTVAMLAFATGLDVNNAATAAEMAARYNATSDSKLRLERVIKGLGNQPDTYVLYDVETGQKTFSWTMPAGTEGGLTVGNELSQRDAEGIAEYVAMRLQQGIDCFAGRRTDCGAPTTFNSSNGAIDASNIDQAEAAYQAAYGEGGEFQQQAQEIFELGKLIGDSGSTLICDVTMACGIFASIKQWDSSNYVESVIVIAGSVVVVKKLWDVFVPANYIEILNKIPDQEYIRLRVSSAHNIDSGTLVLGKYRPTVVNGVEDWSVPGPDSYVAIARSEQATYFDLGSQWGSTASKYSMSDDDMFRTFNIPVLDYSVMAKKQIKFTHDPRIDFGSLKKEWDYLQTTHGFTTLDYINGFWHAVK